MQAVHERDQDKAEELALVRTKQQEVACELEQERAKPAKIKFIFYELERSPRSQGASGGTSLLGLSLNFWNRCA